MRWSGDGRRMLVGDSSGFISLLQVNNELYQADDDDFDKISSLARIR